MRQLLDLEPAWRDHSYFFVTEDSALGRTIAERHTTYFVPHFALGQARLGAAWMMLVLAFRSMLISWRIIWHERPGVVITTGSGSQLFVVLWARLLGAQIVLIDSFARFRGPSKFARIAGPLAHVRIAQSEACGQRWSGAHVFDPFQIIDVPRPAKDPLLFATVGATLPFDRLVTLVARAKAAGHLPEKVLVQTGVGGLQPAGVETVETLPFGELTDLQRRADLVVCHGGTGSLITALREGCRIIAVPRRFSYGEHYDDHQSEIVEALALRGLIHYADTDESFVEALAAARARRPLSATTNPAALIEFLRGYLDDFRPQPDDRRQADSDEGEIVTPCLAP